MKRRELPRFSHFCHKLSATLKMTNGENSIQQLEIKRLTVLVEKQAFSSRLGPASSELAFPASSSLASSLVAHVSTIVRHTLLVLAPTVVQTVYTMIVVFKVGLLVAEAHDQGWLLTTNLDIKKDGTEAEVEANLRAKL